MRIAALVSGGVDSSVAVKLLVDQGHDVRAFYLKVWLEDELSYLGNCPWERDLQYVDKICRDLRIPLEVISLQREYWDSVVRFALSELRAGRTPSPDVCCNRWIKFGSFSQRIDPGFDKIASGHYARVERKGGTDFLLRAPDPVKDQTYFLSRLTQAQLGRVLFPIGDLSKAEVRVLAHDFDLPNKDRKDSQGICFLGKIRYADFVQHHLGEEKGAIRDADSGRQIGEHRGYWFYTIGQRQGLGLSGGPWYVVGKNVEDNVVTVSHADRYRGLSRNEFFVARPNWLSGQPRGSSFLVKVRHGPSLVECEITWLDNGRLQVRMAHPDPGIASGQQAVFYQGEVCLGGGVIEEALEDR